MPLLYLVITGCWRTILLSAGSGGARKEVMVVSEGKPTEISDVAQGEAVESAVFNPEWNYLAFVRPSRSPRDVLSSGRPAAKYALNGMKQPYRSRNYD
jgi:hypothetical protein